MEGWKIVLGIEAHFDWVAPPQDLNDRLLRHQADLRINALANDLHDLLLGLLESRICLECPLDLAGIRQAGD